MVGSRYAMYMGAALLVVGAVFVFVRGTRQVVPADADAPDTTPAAIEPAHLIEMRPALSHSVTEFHPRTGGPHMTTFLVGLDDSTQSIGALETAARLGAPIDAELAARLRPPHAGDRRRESPRP